jgi:hypothetical protein
MSLPTSSVVLAIALSKDRKARDDEDCDEEQTDSRPKYTQRAQHYAIASTGDEIPAAILVILIDVARKPLHRARPKQARQANQQEQCCEEGRQRHLRLNRCLDRK